MTTNVPSRNGTKNFFAFIWHSLSTIASAKKLEVDLQLVPGSDISRSVDQEKCSSVWATSGLEPRN